MTLRLTKKHNFDIVFDSQKVFRLILEAMSNPGTVVNICDCADKLYGDNPVFLAVAITLLDNEVSFHACENTSLSDEIASLTFAKKDPIESADFIFAGTPRSAECAIENAKYGTLADPHKSATVIVKNDGVPACLLTLTGPGIDGRTTIQTTQTAADAIAIRDALNYEYPEGIDLIFISSAGELFAIPRLTRMEVE